MPSISTVVVFSSSSHLASSFIGLCFSAVKEWNYLTSFCSYFVMLNDGTTTTRDAPIIGIGRLWAVLPIIGISRLLCRYRPIVIYYVL